MDTQNEKKQAFVNFKFANAAVKVRDAAVVNLMPGTVVDGKDMTGYSFKANLRDFHVDALQDGKPLSFGFRPSTPVTLFTGSGDDRKEVRVTAASLAEGVKASRDAWFAQHPEFSGPKPERAEAAPARDDVVRVRVSSKAVHSYLEARVDLMPGTKVNGVDLTGYYFTRRIKDRALEQKTMGRPVTFAFADGQSVKLTPKPGLDRPEISVNPWDLASAVKAQREAYREARASEREQAINQDEDREAVASPEQAAAEVSTDSRDGGQYASIMNAFEHMQPAENPYRDAGGYEEADPFSDAQYAADNTEYGQDSVPFAYSEEIEY